MDIILFPVLILGGLGFIFAILLSVASNVFAVEVDPLIEAIDNVLPGANCGACGYPGCAGLAKAIANGQAPLTACSVGGEPVAEKIGDIMGTDAGDVEKEVAVVLCQGDCEKAKEKFIYDGIADCRSATAIQGGSKACSFGCLGCGTCVDACAFDAIDIVDGVAVIDKDKCVSCGKCITACPKNIIELVPYSSEYIVKCKSTDAGRDVRQSCSIGCIGCQICVKACPKEAITFENNLAKIDYEKCINCSICAGKCPTKAIFPGMTKKEQMEMEKAQAGQVKTEDEEVEEKELV